MESGLGAFTFNDITPRAVIPRISRAQVFSDAGSNDAEMSDSDAPVTTTQFSYQNPVTNSPDELDFPSNSIPARAWRSLQP